MARLFLALLALIAISSAPPTLAQPVGDCEDTALRDCCNGIAYWTGYNPQTAQADGTSIATTFEAYWAQNGFLDGSERSRNIWTIAAFSAVFVLLLVLFWLTARRQWIAGWVQLLLLVVIPGVVWYLVPDLLARSEAATQSETFVADTLKRFCTGTAGGALDEVLTAPCTPVIWPAFFRSGDSATALTPTLSCERLDSSDVDALLEDRDNPCARDCAVAMDMSSPDGGPTRLRERWRSISSDLMGTCQGVASNWRAASGPSPSDWRACASSLATRSVKRQVSLNPLHKNGWAGFAIGAVLAALALFFFRRS